MHVVVGADVFGRVLGESPIWTGSAERRFGRVPVGSADPEGLGLEPDDGTEFLVEHSGPPKTGYTPVTLTHQLHQEKHQSLRCPLDIPGEFAFEFCAKFGAGLKISKYLGMPRIHYTLAARRADIVWLLAGKVVAGGFASCRDHYITL